MINRIITGFALLGIGIVVIYNGGLWLMAWVWFVGIMSAYEMFLMVQKKGVKPYVWPAYIFITLTMASLAFPVAHQIWQSWIGQLISLSVLSYCLFELFNKRIYAFDSSLVATLRVSIFVGFLFPYICLLRDGAHGLVHFWFVLLIIWACDVFALFGGKLFGKTPLSSISPKKTVEGSIVGLAMCLVMGAILIVLFHLPVARYLLLALVVGILSQLGDLHESLVKRHFNIKDSSQFLPGHGGFYDRADSTIFSSPPAYFLVSGIF